MIGRGVSMTTVHSVVRKHKSADHPSKVARPNQAQRGDALHRTIILHKDASGLHGLDEMKRLMQHEVGSEVSDDEAEYFLKSFGESDDDKITLDEVDGMLLSFRSYMKDKKEADKIIAKYASTETYHLTRGDLKTLMVDLNRGAPVQPPRSLALPIAHCPLPIAMTAVESLSQDELTKLKREATIKAKEDDYERRRKQEAERKRQQLEELKEEVKNAKQKKLQDRLDTLRRRATIRSQREAQTERLNKRREEKIEQRNQAWLARSNSEIQQILVEAQKEEERVQEALNAARQRKNKKRVGIDLEKREQKGQEYVLDVRRKEKITEKDSQREIREIHRVDQLKTEAQQELQSFIQNPYPVPLKQVLAGSVRPVPKVTELLAAYKDQREDLADLQAQDIPMRALLRNQSVFQYVRDIQMKAESERMVPPEPSVGDTGRGLGRGKKPGSPNRKGRSPSNWRGTLRSTRT